MNMDERLAETARASSWIVQVTVHDKTIDVPVGKGTQCIRWLANVAISCWDEEQYEGWRQLGIPTRVNRLPAGEKLSLDASIRDFLKPGDHVQVYTSLHSN